MENILIFLVGALLGSLGALFLKARLTPKVACSSQAKVSLALDQKGKRLIASPNPVCVNANGTLTWENAAGEDVDLEFQPKGNRKDPFKGRGKYPVQAGKSSTTGPADDPGKGKEEKWKYTGSTKSGKKFDPEVMIKS